jgi:hypothetical protein
MNFLTFAPLSNNSFHELFLSQKRACLLSAKTDV